LVSAEYSIRAITPGGRRPADPIVFGDPEPARAASEPIRRTPERVGRAQGDLRALSAFAVSGARCAWSARTSIGILAELAGGPTRRVQMSRYAGDVERKRANRLGNLVGRFDRHRVMKSLLAVLAIIAAGCASGHESVSAARSAQPPIATTTSSPQDRHYVEAVAEADRLLADVRLPQGTTIRAGFPPAALSGPIMGTPSSSHFIDEARLWSVPMSITDVLAWLRSHPLAGLTRDGASSGTGPRGESSGYSWSATPTDAYENPELQVGVTPDGTSQSIMRADGVDIWLSSAPVVGSPPGSKVRVTIVGGCPTTIAGYVDVSNPGADLTSTMLPAANPTAGLICSYNAAYDSTHPSTLAHTIILSAAASRVLARSANAIWTGSAGSGSGSCPLDNGLTDIIVFRYVGQADVDLWYHASGCQGVTNGYIDGGEGGNPSFYDGFQPLIASLAPRWA
jgi:hypothetical protein